MNISNQVNAAYLFSSTEIKRTKNNILSLCPVAQAEKRNLFPCTPKVYHFYNHEFGFVTFFLQKHPVETRFHSVKEGSKNL